METTIVLKNIFPDKHFLGSRFLGEEVRLLMDQILKENKIVVIDFSDIHRIHTSFWG